MASFPSLRTLRGLHVANVAQFSAQQTNDIVQCAYALKCVEERAAEKAAERAAAGRRRAPGGAAGRRRALQGRRVALLFEKPSTRTRLAIHAAITEDGGSAIDLGGGTIHGVGKESLADTVRTVAQFCDVVAYRGVSHETFEEVCRHSTVPVINALTSRYHPTQALADFLTIREQFGTLAGVTIAYLGDCNNNIARSLALASVQTGVSLKLAAPTGYELDSRTVSLCEAIAPTHERLPEQMSDPARAVRNADAIYTDVWYSMGDEAERQQRTAALREYRVTPTLLKGASERAIFMHCLPANRGEEVVDEVMDGERSVVWRQAGNRRYIFKVLLRRLLRG